MQTLAVTRDYYLRKCGVCGFTERLRRAGKVTYYSVEAESQRDFERRAKAKELLQPQPGKYDQGSVNELFEEAYGDPHKKFSVGEGSEKMRIKEETKDQKWQKQIRKARKKK